MNVLSDSCSELTLSILHGPLEPVFRCLTLQLIQDDRCSDKEEKVEKRTQGICQQNGRTDWNHRCGR